MNGTMAAGIAQRMMAAKGGKLESGSQKKAMSKSKRRRFGKKKKAAPAASGMPY